MAWVGCVHGYAVVWDAISLDFSERGQPRRYERIQKGALKIASNAVALTSFAFAADDSLQLGCDGVGLWFRATLAETAGGYAVQKLATSLMDKGFVREIRAKPGMPAWRRDEGGRTYALVIADPNAQIRIKPITSCLAWRRSPVQPA
jgi:hypothetical protein